MQDDYLYSIIKLYYGALYCMFLLHSVCSVFSTIDITLYYILSSFVGYVVTKTL